MNNKTISFLTLLPLFLVIVIDTMGSSLVIPILSPLFITKTTLLAASVSLPVREFLYGFTLAIFCVFMLFGAPFLGDLSDYFGRKKVLLISLMGTAISYFVSGVGVVWHSAAILIAGRCIAGFFAGSQPIAQAAIAELSTPENKAGNLSFIVFAASIGFIIGPIMGGYLSNPKLVSWFTFATPFFAAAIIAVLNAVSVVVTLKEKPVQRQHNHLQLTKGLFAFISGFTHKSIRQNTLTLFFMQIGFAIYFAFIPIFLVQQYHYNSAALGHFLAYLGVIWAITFLFLIRVILRFINLNQAVIIGFIINTLSFFATMWSIPWITWLMVIPIAISNGMSYTAIMTLLSNSKPQAQGWIMGISSAVMAASWGLGTLFAGILGSYLIILPFAVAAVLTLFALAIFLVKKNNEKNKKN